VLVCSDDRLIIYGKSTYENKAMFEKIQYNKCFSSITTFRRVISISRLVFAYSKSQLQQYLKYANELKIVVTIIGGGSNILPVGSHFEGMIIVFFGGEVEVEKHARYIKVSANCTLSKAIKILSNCGVDMSALSGIPGSLGGAVINNAGVTVNNKNISSYVDHVLAINKKTGKELTLSNRCMGYSHRSSILKNSDNDIVIVDIAFKKSNENTTDEDIINIQNSSSSISKSRKKKNKEGLNTAGSFFVNNIGEDYLARDLIKNIHIKNNNIYFTENYSFLKLQPNDDKLNSITCDAEIRDFITTARYKVKSLYGVNLVPEVQFLGNAGFIDYQKFLQ